MMRCSSLATGLISPDSPTSPAKVVCWSTGASRFDDSTALTTARSMAGSLTFSPPAIFRNTSFTPSRNPALFSSTARSMFSLRVSNPVELLCGVP